MTRRARTLLMIVTVGALALPSGASAVSCTSSLPVSDPHLANYECDGVHPGMLLRIPSQKYGELRCTAAFAFMDQYRERYLTFPGTCHLDYDCLEDIVADELPPPLDQIVRIVPTCTLPLDSEIEPNYKRSGPVVKDKDGRRIGRIVYAVNKQGVDFAVVRIDSSVSLDPRLPFYGGPLKMGGAPKSPTEAYSYSAAPTNPAPNARSGVLHTVGGGVYHQAPAGFFSTAAGSPVMTPDGMAIGYYDGPLTVGYGWRTVLYDEALDWMASRTGLRLRIMSKS
jgi:hypothetical protein